MNIREIEGKKGKSYQVSVRIKGAKPMYKTFKRKTDAVLWGQGVENPLKRGFDIKENEARKHIVNEAIERYIDNELPKRLFGLKNNFQIKAKEEEIRKIKSQLQWWKKQIGYLYLSEVTPSVLGDCRDKLFKEDISKQKDKIKRRTPATVVKYTTRFNLVLKKCCGEWGWLDANPMAKTDSVKVDNERTRFLSDKEKDKLLKVAKECQNKKMYLLIYMAITSGARKSEMLRLTWKDIDFENRMYYFMKTKNGSNRGVPIAMPVYKLLFEYSKIRNIKSDYIFANSEGKIMDIDWYWNEIRTKAGLYNHNVDDESNLHFHDLRHTSASYFAMNGATQFELCELLGHETLEAVKRYAHLFKKHTFTLVDSTCNKHFAM